MSAFALRVNAFAVVIESAKALMAFEVFCPEESVMVEAGVALPSAIV